MTTWLTPRRASLLRKTCRQIAAKDGVSIDVDELFNHLRELDQLWRDRNQRANHKVRRRFSTALMIVEIGAAVLAELSAACDSRRRKRLPILWSTERKRPNQGSAAFVLGAVLANLANSALATRHLLSAGFEQQAHLVVRSFVETGELALAIATDYDTYRTYLNAPADMDRAAKYWRTHLGHDRLLAKLQPGYRNLMGRSVAKSIFSYKRNRYRFLSARSHVHPIGMAVGAHAITKRRVASAIGGATGGDTEGVFDDITFAIFEVVSMLVAILRGFHGWDFEQMSGDWPHLIAKWRVVRTLDVAHVAKRNNAPLPDIRFASEEV